MDKARLLKPRLPEATVDIPGVGTVRVRGLSREEAMSIRDVPHGPGRAQAIERRMLAAGLIDPELTEAEVGEWQQACTAGEMDPVTDKVAELTGLSDGAAKEAYKTFEADSDSEFRVLPGAEAGDDGGAAAG